ncbi:MAG: trypsin-like serine protease [Burkholderiales bacterium]|nr:MAG: trypsin-like serine protease [Burkholderiales bacterium]
MRRPALYSSSSRPTRESPGPHAAGEAAQAAPSPRASRLAKRLHLNDIRLLWGVVALLALLLALSLSLSLRPGALKLTQDDINAAVIKTLETVQLPSAAARAAAAIHPSVVRVSGYSKEKGAKEETQNGVGTGVVIVDKGVILTNLHVVQGAETIKVTFADGLEATATVTGVQPENDLAVLQATRIPDDLVAATMRSTADLTPGDQVVAVGFPFGIGPSTSAGVISGLKRNFRSPEGKQMMSNLIQFDAAANPGNSGGPLVTMDGEVIGIVTAIYNPNQQRTFVGIGFAVPIENAASAAGMTPF